MKINVLINSGNRPKDLARLLKSMVEQTRRPDCLYILIHPRDTESDKIIASLIDSIIPYTLHYKDQLGPIAAMDHALHSMSCDVVAFTHDDAAPRPTWLEQIENILLSKAECAGVGGRDLAVLEDQSKLPKALVVGKVSWCGKIYGQHYLPCVGARYVDFLSGVNMAYRHEVLLTIGFDLNLQWQQETCWHWEMGLGLGLTRNGWKQWYDPDIVVEHYPGKLFTEKKDNYWISAARGRAFNETYILMKYLSFFRGCCFLLLALMVGSRDCYGIVQWLRFSLKERNLALRKLTDTQQGRYNALKTLFLIKHQQE